MAHRDIVERLQRIDHCKRQNHSHDHGRIAAVEDHVRDSHLNVFDEAPFESTEAAGLPYRSIVELHLAINAKDAAWSDFFTILENFDSEKPAWNDARKVETELFSL